MAEITFAVCTVHTQLYRGSSAHIKHGCPNAVVFQTGFGIVKALIIEEFGVITEFFTGICDAILFKRDVTVIRLDYEITVFYRDIACIHDDRPIQAFPSDHSGMETSIQIACRIDVHLQFGFAFYIDIGTVCPYCIIGACAVGHIRRVGHLFPVLGKLDLCLLDITQVSIDVKGGSVQDGNAVGVGAFRRYDSRHRIILDRTFTVFFPLTPIVIQNRVIRFVDTAEVVGFCINSRAVINDNFSLCVYCRSTVCLQIQPHFSVGFEVTVGVKRRVRGIHGKLSVAGHRDPA